MKYYYQLLNDSNYNVLIIYSEKSLNDHINRVLYLNSIKQDYNKDGGPGIVIDFEDETWFNCTLELNHLNDIDMSMDTKEIIKITNKSLSIEHIDIIENIIKVTYWKEFTVCSTELKMIIEILVDRYIKHIENEE